MNNQTLIKVILVTNEADGNPGIVAAGMIPPWKVYRWATDGRIHIPY